MTQPPYQHDPNRPQDGSRNFPSYTEQQRPQDTPPRFVPPYSAPQQSPQPPYPPYQQQYPQAYGPPPTPYGYGYGYPGTSARATNSLAIAALITGLASILITIAAPVAIGLGIAALVQIRRRNEQGTAQAVVGLISGSVVTLVGAGVIALIAIGIATEDDEFSSGMPDGSSSSAPTSVYIEALVVGDCFDDAADEDEVERQPCTSPHDGELYAVVSLPAQPWPGDKKLGDLAEAACDKAFLPYVGIDVDDSELEPATWYPEAAGWNSGDRDVYCTAYGPFGDQLDSTVKDSKR